MNINESDSGRASRFGNKRKFEGIKYIYYPKSKNDNKVTQ
jgi:hypothetical protein